jgi:DNA/RNA-binding domain of Phe-tRNA-synthetase-like protein
MVGFRYTDLVVAAYPTIIGGVIRGTPVHRGPLSEQLRAHLETEQAATLGRLGETALSDVPSLAAWRRAFRQFGVDPTAYRSAAEALLRRLTKQGSIPSINTLVDIGNMVSIRYALPVAVFDLARIDGGLTVRFADGDELFTDLGSGVVQTPEPGEVIFTDDANRVHARRWCWRQSAESAASEDTTAIMVTIEGHHETAAADVADAIRDFEELLRRYADPTEMATGFVSAASPSWVSPLGREAGPSG